MVEEPTGREEAPAILRWYDAVPLWDAGRGEAQSQPEEGPVIPHSYDAVRRSEADLEEGLPQPEAGPGTLSLTAEELRIAFPRCHCWAE